MKKITYVGAITLVIVGLMISSATSVSINVNDNQSENVDQFISVSTPISKALTKDISPSGAAPLFAGTKITGGDYDERHPSVADSPTGIFFAQTELSEDGSMWQPTVFSSDETGTVWTGLVTFLYPGAEFTALDSNSVGTYGTFGAPVDTSSQVVFFQAENTDNSGVFDWGTNGFSNLFYDDLAAYNDPNPNATDMGWNLALTGSYGGDDGVPMIMYLEFGPNNYGLMSRAPKTGYQHATCSADQEKVYMYNVYDRTDGTNLYVRVTNLGKWNYNSAQQYWSHPDKKTLTIAETQFQVKYPSVAAANDTVMIVAQKINGSENDIICYTSTNGLTAYNRVMVAESADDEMYPQIALIGGTTAVCTYYKNNILYYKNTTDGGATWGPETQLSDSQGVANYRGQDVCARVGSGFGVWEDNRGSNVDIYFDEFVNFPFPNIQIGEVTGGIGKVSMVVNNIGEGDASNVAWSITVKGGILQRIDVTTTGTIDALAKNGGTTTVKTDKFIFGLGTLSITVTAGGQTKTYDGTELFIYTIVKA